MSKVYRIGVIGVAHSHIDSNVMAFATCGDKVKFVACADLKPLVPSKTHEPGTRNFLMDWCRDNYGMKQYDDYRTMLAENEIDIALVCAENAFHPALIEDLLLRGIHVVVEKPLAANMQGAMRIARAVEASGKEVFINWPTAWSPAVRQAKKLCDAGEIGKLFKFTFRNSDSQGALSYGQIMTDAEKGAEWWHQSKPGGGSMLDYCCYGSCMSGWFLGEDPVGAYGLKANFGSPYASAEDYATITVRFPSSVAILEGSWSTVNTGIPNGPIMYGLEGTMVVDNNEIRVYKHRHVTKPDLVISEPEPLPEGRENLGKEVLHHLETGEPVFEMLSLKRNLTAMSILDAGARSATSGNMVFTNDGHWCIGEDDYLTVR